MIWISLIGFTGMFLILLAFIMEQWHKWKDDSFVYGISNSLGSLLMCIYAVFIKSIPFLILNLTWLIVSLRDVIKKKV